MSLPPPADSAECIVDGVEGDAKCTHRVANAERATGGGTEAN